MQTLRDAFEEIEAEVKRIKEEELAKKARKTRDNQHEEIPLLEQN